jgi:D-glycero-D-manno-heptose 1,7-bisphosphate phosphatase
VNSKIFKPAIFLDRDGVINVKLPEDQYVKKPSEFVFIPDSIDALSILQCLGYLLFIVTNQRGIARGLMSHADLEHVHEFMKTELLRSYVNINGIYYCPHEKDVNCGCRKPAPGLLREAISQFDIDVKKSYMVGDSISDILAGRAVGLKTVYISPASCEMADSCFSSLYVFAQHLQKIKVRSNDDSQE